MFSWRKNADLMLGETGELLIRTCRRRRRLPLQSTAKFPPPTRRLLEAARAVKGRFSMRYRIALLPIILLSAALVVRAEDLQNKGSIRRLDYVHFDAVTQTVEWSVSEGTLDADGRFVPNEETPATYSIKVGSGLIKHDGEAERLSETDTVRASQMFAVLSQMMRTYTDEWGESNDPDVQNSDGDDLDDNDDAPLRSIAAHCRTDIGRSSFANHNTFLLRAQGSHSGDCAGAAVEQRRVSAVIGSGELRTSERKSPAPLLPPVVALQLQSGTQVQSGIGVSRLSRFEIRHIASNSK